MRINELDELQLVRHVVPTDGSPEAYDVVAKFGNKAGRRIAAERGYAALDAERTQMDTAAASVSAYIQSFSAYDSYIVYGALYPLTASPTTSDVVADAASHGYVSGTLQAAIDNTTVYSFTTLADGSSVPATMLKFCAVNQMSDGTLSASPHLSFVLTDTSFFGSIGSTQTQIAFSIRIPSISWNDLSASDKTVFRIWMQDQIVRGAAKRGIDVTSVDITLSNGSILVDVVMFISTADTSKTVASISDSSSPLNILDSPDAIIPFVDRPAAPLDTTGATSQIITVSRVGSKPEVLSFTESSSTSSSVTYSYEVVESNPDVSVDTLFVLVTTSQLYNPIPSAIVSDDSVQTFPLSSASGSISVNLDSGVRSFVYVVARNNDSPAILSRVISTVSEPFSILMPSSATMSDGLYDIATASGTTVTTQEGMTVFSSAESGSAYLILYPSGDAQVPTTADQAQAQIDAGVTFVSGSLTPS